MVLIPIHRPLIHLDSLLWVRKTCPKTASPKMRRALVNLDLGPKFQSVSAGSSKAWKRHVSKRLTVCTARSASPLLWWAATGVVRCKVFFPSLLLAAATARAIALMAGFPSDCRITAIEGNNDR